jgi:O-antigen/teichoic acid export membrane protein
LNDIPGRQKAIVTATPEPATDRPDKASELHRSQGLFRRVLGNASILLGGKAATAVLGLATTAFAARALGLHDFGILTLIYAFTNAVSDLVEFQSWQVILHYGTRPLQEGRLSLFQRVLSFSLMLDGIGAVAGLCVGIAGVLLFGQQLGWSSGITPVVLLYTTSVVWMASATATGVLRLVDRFDLIAIQDNAQAAVRLIGAAIAFFAGGGLIAFLVVWYVASMLSFVCRVYFAWRELYRHGYLQDFQWNARVLTQGLPGIWRFCLTTNFNGTLQLAFTHIGTLSSGWFLGPSAAALYRVARQVATAIVKPTRLVMPALYPELARLWAIGNTKALYRLVMQVALSGGALATGLLIVAAFGGSWALRTALGDAFAGAAPVMTWLVGSAAIGIWALPLEPFLISTGRATAAFVTRAAVTVLYLPCLFFGLEWYGLLGAGYATVAAMGLLFLVQFAVVLQIFRTSRREPPSRIPQGY